MDASIQVDTQTIVRRFRTLNSSSVVCGKKHNGSATGPGCVVHDRFLNLQKNGRFSDEPTKKKNTELFYTVTVRDHKVLLEYLNRISLSDNLVCETLLRRGDINVGNFLSPLVVDSFDETVELWKKERSISCC